MALEVTIDHPDFPDGYEFGIAGIGLVKNRESREVTEDEERGFISFYGKKPEDQLKGDGTISFKGSAIVGDISEIVPDEISDRAPLDPTAMNIDPTTGEVFEHANLNGAASSEQDDEEAEEKPQKTAAGTGANVVPQPPAPTTNQEGGDNS